jgi:hypothetical protein
MSTMAFGIYSSEGGNAINTNELLIVEIGYSHMACLASGSDNMITGFELYTFSKEEVLDFENLFAGILAKSQMLNKTYTGTKLYINNEYALLIPAFKFDKAICNDYLNAVFGEEEKSNQQFDKIDNEANLINVFRYSEEWFNVLNHHFKMGDVNHSYTPIIGRVITASSNSTFIKVKFYPAYFIAIVIKEGVFQFIQSFIYQSSEDVLYYLLSISQRFNLNTTDLIIYVSGMIDLQSALHAQLEKFFGNIVVEEVDKSRLVIDVSKHPSHYFTPFFNLAL